jgi:hypothetical protein
MALAELAHEGEQSLANRVLRALRAMPSLPSPYHPPPQEPAERPQLEEAQKAAASVTVPAEEAGAAHLSLPGLTIPFAGLFSPAVRPISSSLEEYVRMVGLVIQGLAREGNVLIVGRGGQVLLKKHPNALHIQIVAPFDDRVEEIMTRKGLDKRAAQSRVRASDRARFDYVRRYHDANWLDPTLYHLVINRSAVSLTTAVDLIITAQQAMKR